MNAYKYIIICLGFNVLPYYLVISSGIVIIITVHLIWTQLYNNIFIELEMFLHIIKNI